MRLNDAQIIAACSGKTPLITPHVPYLISEIKGHKIISYGTSGAGYDIRLGTKFLSPLRNPVPIDPLNVKASEYQEFNTDSKVTIEPGSYLLGVSHERFCLPNDLTGECVGKSTYARIGVQVIVTPLEAGWEGWLTIEVVNSGPRPAYVYPGMGICQIRFDRHAATTTPYRRKYQNQSEQPVISK